MTAYDEDVVDVPVRPVERAAPISTRAPAPRPRRLSRRAITLFVGGSAIGLAAALGFALSSNSRHATPQETVVVDRHQQPDLLATAPKDYASVSRTKAASLGPPATPGLPGTPSPDAAAAPAAGAAPSGSTNNDAGAAVQRQRQQRDSARASKLFATSGEAGRSASATDASAPPATSPASSQEPPGSTGTADAQDRKAAFVAGGARAPTVNSGRLTTPAGRYVVTVGSTIAAALITGLSSDLPGEVVAQVTKDVFDSPTGRTKLIPQATRLIGSYDAHVGYGNRAR